MKAWNALWRRTKQPSAPEMLPVIMEKLTAAQQAHIADLRLLIDQAHEREKELAGMVRLVMEERFFRPTVTRPAAGPVSQTAAHLESLNDVATFDEEADAKTMEAQTVVQREMEQEYAQILAEENEHRASRGLDRV